jgi:hypothetical protein
VIVGGCYSALFGLCSGLLSLIWVLQKLQVAIGESLMVLNCSVFFLVVVVGVFCAQVCWVVVFWVLFWVWVVVLGLFGCCSGCGCVFSTWLLTVSYWLLI